MEKRNRNVAINSHKEVAIFYTILEFFFFLFSIKPNICNFTLATATGRFVFDKNYFRNLSIDFVFNSIAKACRDFLPQFFFFQFFGPTQLADSFKVLGRQKKNIRSLFEVKVNVLFFIRSIKMLLRTHTYTCTHAFKYIRMCIFRYMYIYVCIWENMEKWNKHNKFKHLIKRITDFI